MGAAWRFVWSALQLGREPFLAVWNDASLFGLGTTSISSWRYTVPVSSLKRGFSYSLWVNEPWLAKHMRKYSMFWACSNLPVGSRGNARNEMSMGCQACHSSHALCEISHDHSFNNLRSTAAKHLSTTKLWLSLSHKAYVTQYYLRMSSRLANRHQTIYCSVSTDIP